MLYKSKEAIKRTLNRSKSRAVLCTAFSCAPRISLWALSALWVVAWTVCRWFCVDRKDHCNLFGPYNKATNPPRNTHTVPSRRLRRIRQTSIAKYRIALYVFLERWLLGFDCLKRLRLLHLAKPHYERFFVPTSLAFALLACCFGCSIYENAQEMVFNDGTFCLVVARTVFIVAHQERRAKHNLCEFKCTHCLDIQRIAWTNYICTRTCAFGYWTLFSR